MRAFCSGLTRAKMVASFTATVSCVSSRESRSVPVSVPPESTPSLRQTVSATSGLSPVTILTVMPSWASRAIDAAAEGLGWSRKTRKPARVRSCSSSVVERGELGSCPAGDGHHAVARAELGVEHSACFVGNVGAAVEDCFGGALGDEERLAVVLGEHRHTAAVVIEGGDGDPPELPGRTGGRAGCFPEGDVEGVAAHGCVAGRGGLIAHQAEREDGGAGGAGRCRSLVRS